MGAASFILGLLSLTSVCVALLPLLNVLNCVSLPLAVVGSVLGFVDLLRERRGGRGLAIAGLILNLLALTVGGARFLISVLTTGGWL
jgi:hypothetical protein